MKNVSEKTEFVKQYYGKTLQGKKDLKTSTCKCDDESLSQYIRAIEKKIDSEMLMKVYGCGSPIPPAIEGCTVLDLECGAGRDVNVVSHLTGPEGFVTGVDMTDEQLEIAERHIDTQMKKFGYERPNVAFRKGNIEDLKGYPHAFALDDHHRFITGKPMLVCGNTASTLRETRFSKHFEVSGDRSVHFGPFDCVSAYGKQKGDGEGGGACC